MKTVPPGSRQIALVFFALELGMMLTLLSALAQSPGSLKTEPTRAQNQQYAELEKAPEKARNKRNPLEGNSDAVAAGRKLFEQHCAECHGETAAGKKKAPSLRSPEVQTATPGTLFWILTNGVVRRGMPVWSKLPDQQRWQLVAYLKSLQ